MTNVLKVILGLLVFGAGTAHAGLEWSFSASSVNADGPNTASATVKVMPDANQLANAGSIDPISNLSFNLSVGMFGDLAGQTASFTVTPLVPPSGAAGTGYNFNTSTGDGVAFASGLAANGNGQATVINIANGSSFGLAFVHLNSPSPVPTFASLFPGGTTMIDAFQLDITLSDGFELGVDDSKLVLTLEPGDIPIRTQFGEIGDPARAADDPLYAADFTNVSQLTTTLAVPEPSSFAYLGLFTLCVTGISWYRRRTQA